jgi:diguanylate cyclase (GGDEF)-like protein
MAEHIITLHDSRKKLSELNLSEQDLDCITTGTDMNNMATRLHGSIDFYQLFDTFTEELGKEVPYDGIEYKDENTKTYLVRGILQRHQCTFQLNYDEQSLGSMTITRDCEFKDREFGLIEVMLAGLTLPLRNALRYKQVVMSAQRDQLTGLRNQYYYQDIIELEIKRAQRYKTPFSLLIFDIDNLDGINNKYGRQAGDAILLEVARRIEKKARSSDIVYRYAGDEFIVILPNTEKNKAIEAAERITGFVLSDNCAYDGEDIVFNLSAGVVSVIYEDTVCNLMDRANRSLSLAKASGGSCISGELTSASKQVRYLK